MHIKYLFLVFASLLMSAFLAGLLVIVNSNMAQTQSAEDIDSMSFKIDEPPSTTLWTNWGSFQYALADDGQLLWIGATGGIVQWDKETRTHQRYTAVDGLPHTKVLAVAVDGAGNRWFGGDGGLSRLDTTMDWTHYTTENSDLHTNLVDAIAVTTEDTLYLSHGLPNGSISRRDADGSWHSFPDLESAIEADYALIQQTQNQTPLWTVVGTEIWRGYRTFDGTMWQDRTPPNITTDPVATVADSAGHVWMAAGMGGLINEWDGSTWTEHYFPIFFSGRITALAVDREDVVWVGWQDRPGPYTSETAAITQLSGDISHNLNTAGPVMMLLTTDEGVWGVGPGWLAGPDGSVTLFDDAPRLPTLPDVLTDNTGKVWLYSGYQQPYSIGAVQTFSDNGTAALYDDKWQLLPLADPPQLGFCEIVSAFERSANNDVWYASYCEWRVRTSYKVVRYHDQQRIEYSLTGGGQTINDIFVQDEAHTWFTFVADYELARGILSLDDGGTPADMSDDVWQTYPIESSGQDPVVAVDANGQLWYGDSSGLYRYVDEIWEPVDQDNSVRDLVPATDGTLYVMRGCCSCCSTNVLTIRPDGTREEPRSVRSVIEREPALAQTANRRNALWTVAPDDAIWYFDAQSEGQELQRRAPAPDGGLQTYALPIPLADVKRMEVDAENHVWLVANDQLWRMSGQVDFALSVQPATWLLAPARSREADLIIESREGYSGTVALTTINRPSDLTVTINPNPVAAGQTTRLTVAADPSSLPTVHNLTIQASDGLLTHTVTLTIVVASELQDIYLPFFER